MIKLLLGAPGWLIWGAWVAQSVECLTLDISSGCDLTVMGLRATLGSVFLGPA